MLNRSLPNCSCGLDIQSSGDTYKTSNFFIVIILIPVTAVFGYFGNFTTAYVYSRRAMRRLSSNVYLCALACSDLFVLSTGLCVMWLDSARGLMPLLDPIFGWQALPNLTLALVFQTTSVYITIFATIDGFIRVCGTKRLQSKFCRPTTAIFLVLSTVSGSVFFHLIRVWMLDIRQCILGQTIKFEICSTDFGMSVSIPYNLYATSLVMVIGPFSLLAILTTIIIHQTWQMSKRGKRTGSDSVSTLVLVALMFLFCNVLTVVTTVVEGFLHVDLVFINFLADIGNYLVIFNASVNFLIYLRLDYAYRVEFVKRICKMKARSIKKAASFDQECQATHEANYNTIAYNMTTTAYSNTQETTYLESQLPLNKRSKGAFSPNAS